MSISLKSLHTFSVDITADKVFFFSSIEQLRDIYKKNHEQPWLILGAGSNVLFTEHFLGSVWINQLKGFSKNEDNNFFYLEFAAGENWHKIVEQTLQLGIYGLENLALIPGNIGSAPIQNIGAYGAEFKDFCNFVEYLDFNNMQIQRLSVDNCCFGYRDSIFKHKLKNKVCITKVGLKLPKKWIPNLNYSPLNQLDYTQVTAQQIFDLVCQTRKQKLPDYKIFGNAGSFFKNPVIDLLDFERLQQQYPTIPYHKNNNSQVKLAAGWLIEQAGLKGFSVGGASVDQTQALILINKNNATGKDVVKLANIVIDKVFTKFSVKIEPEVRIFEATGEIKI